MPRFYQVPRARRAMAWTWLMLLCALLLAQTIARAGRAGGIDLTSYLLSARALAHGATPYELPTPFPYLYPPTLAFLLIPLTHVPQLAGVCLWFALGVVCAIWSVRSIAIAARPELEGRPDEVAVFVALFLTFFFAVVQSNLRNGQVNFAVLALCCSASLSGERGGLSGERRSLSGERSAAAWSLAIAIKIVPLALAPYFLFRRRWSWPVVAIACLMVLLLLPAVVVGSRIVEIYEEYWRVFLGSSFARAQPLDFSLAGPIAFALGRPVAPFVRFGMAIAAMIVVTLWDLRQTRVRDAEAFALYLLAIPLVSPQSEVHHLAFAFPAAAVAASDWWRGAIAGAAFRASCVIAAACYVAATIVTGAAGPLLCAFLIALAAAVVTGPP